MKIWLDDLRDPKRFNKEESEWSTAHWVKTAELAIKLLNEGSVTHISFDHDLGTQADGNDVAQEIERLVFEGKIAMPIWQVHSANPVGRNEIIAAMRSAERHQNQDVDM